MYTFEEIVGNERIIKNLQSAILNDRLSHAYIIDGAYGSGKKLLANTLAKTLQCEKYTNDACCECISCHTFDSGNHTDIIYVKATKTKAIGIDDIRQQIGGNIGIKPYKYKYKIFIIEDADKMTTQSQNAMLKNMEEPPSYVIFLLLSTNFNSFLSTILSRCVLLKLKPLPEYIIKKYIQNDFDIDSNLALVYSSFSQGSIGKAKDIANSDTFIQKREKVISWIIELKNKDIIQVFENAKEIEIYKDDINDILDICFIWYRDVLIIKNLNSEKYIIQKDKIDLLQKEASEINYNNIFKLIDIIENTRYQLNRNANFQLAIELMLLKIKEAKK